MSNKTKIARLKQTNDVLGLLEMLENEKDWMLSLDIAEALAQMGDKHGFDRLIIALDSSNVDVRDVAREILEGLDDPRVNQVLKQSYKLENDFSNKPEIKRELLTQDLLNKRLETAKILMFSIAIIVSATNIGDEGFLGFIKSVIHEFPSNLFSDIVLFLFFPFGIIAIPDIFFPKLFHQDYLALFLSPFSIIIAAVGWFVYYRIALFGAKIKNLPVFIIVYILFIVLLLGNLAGCTLQISFIKSLNLN
jgi:hypothetical protein